MDVISSIISRIKESKKIAILYHIHADGDAVGSSLALKLAFLSDDNVIDIYGEEQVQNQLMFLADSENIIVPDKSINKIYDLVIVLDSGSINRLGKRISIYNSAQFKVNIDHHVTNNILSDINYIDANASACGEIIYKIIRQADIDIHKNVATCLYTAISTDTGSFKYSNTTSETHKIASELIEKGADSTEISRRVYETVPFSRIKLLAKIFDSMELFHQEKVSILLTTNEILSGVGATIDDLDNIANHGTSVENVELAIFLREATLGGTRVSLRSKYYFDCSELAKQFGGGGHCRAAGCEINAPINDVKEMLLEKIKEFGI